MSVQTPAPAALTLPAPGRIIAGTDEAGRGCLAGPVVAAAVILPATYDLPGLTDSKKLTARARERLYAGIRAQAVTWAVAAHRAAEIDAMNILAASLSAMRRAVGRLAVRPELVYVDGNRRIPQADFAQETVVDGDALIPAISAASILAKVLRDRIMTALDRRYPGYGLAGHKGYGSAAHLADLRELGPSPIHRLTFARVRPEAASAEQMCLPGL